MKWAAYKISKKGEVPTGASCYLCAAVAANAFGTKTWSEVVSTAKSSGEFARSVMEAREKLQEMGGELPAKAWHSEALQEESRVSIKMSRSCLFLSFSEFEERFKTKVAHFGPGELPIEELRDESGILQRGIVLADPDSPFRKITVEAEMGKRLHKTLLDPSDMLRPNQHGDMMQYLVQEDSKQRGRALKAPHTEDDMKKLVERAEGRLQSATNPAAVNGLGTEGRAPSDLASPQKGMGVEDASSPEGQVISKVGPNLGQVLLQQQQSVKGPKAKAKGKGRKAEGPSDTSQPKKKARVEHRSATDSTALSSRSSLASSASTARRMKGQDV